MIEFLGRTVADYVEHGDFASLTTIVHRNPRTNNPRRWHFFIVRKSDGAIMERREGGNKHWQQTRRHESDSVGRAFYETAWQRFIRANDLLTLDDLVERKEVLNKATVPVTRLF